LVTELLKHGIMYASKSEISSCHLKTLAQSSLVKSIQEDSSYPDADSRVFMIKNLSN